MLKNLGKIIIIFVFGIFGGIFADQILWPYFIEMPLFYKYRLDQAPIFINQTEQIFIEENNALENAVEKVEKSVVGIKSGKGIEGSGIIITSDGLILTLSGLISQKGSTVVFSDGEASDFKILKKDAESNLVLIKIEKTSLPTISFADSGSLRFGQRVFMLGFYFKNNELSKIVNEGIIKTYNKEIIETNISEESYLKGSPLFNVKGELAGLNTIDSDNKVSSIPINKIRDFIGF